jgi:hypothetical protein
VFGATPVQPWRYNEEEIGLCVAYINEELKKIKFKKLWQTIRKRKQISKAVKLPDLGHNQELVRIILGINQFVFDRRSWLHAMAHDYKFTQMDEYVQVCDKFVCSQVQLLLVYFSQTIYRRRPNDHDHHRIKFWRISTTESLFDQLVRQTRDPVALYRVGRADDKPFRARFKGEDSYDAGGPFRDVCELICSDIIEKYF